MYELRNHAKERLQAGKLILGHNIRYARTSEVAAICRRCGYHYMWLDDEHSPKEPQLWLEMAMSGVRLGVTPFMRTRSHDPAEISLHLTNGALGVVIPHVNTEEEARAVARASRFYPEGDQSVPGFFPQIDYRMMRPAEATAEINAAITVCVMLEHAQAVENADAMASVEGVDVLFLGLTDLTYDLGIPSQYDHPDMMRAVEKVCAAARRHGKFVGMGGPGPNRLDLWQQYVDMGAQMLLTQNDIGMLVTRATEIAEMYSALKAD